MHQDKVILQVAQLCIGGSTYAVNALQHMLPGCGRGG